MTYPGATAASLRSVDLEVRGGALIAVAGASGSGKSTLLDVISGVAPRTTGGERSGVVRLGSHVLGGVRRVADDSLLVVAMFQDPESQVLVGPVAEEVAFGPRHAGLPIDEIEQRVRWVLERLAITHLAHRDCASLSGGELQRVLLAACLVLRPQVLVLDEPTSQIDAASERLFWSAIDDVRRERGVTIIAADHRLDQLVTRADQVVVCAEGRVVATCLPSQLAERAPWLMEDPYRGVVPSRPTMGAAARLQVRLDRVMVGERALFRSLSFALAPGAVVTLEGASGVGKSTLLRAVRGLHPSAGSVLVDGVDRGVVSSSARAMAFLSQAAGPMVPGRTVIASATDTCRRLGLDPAAAVVALRGAGLGDRAMSHPSTLSVGERQRLAFVAATAHRPLVWLLDEPTRGMDPAARRWLAGSICAHASSGGVVLVATHDAQLAAAIATHRLRVDTQSGTSLVMVSRDHRGRALVDAGARPSAASGGVEAP